MRQLGTCMIFLIFIFKLIYFSFHLNENSLRLKIDYWFYQYLVLIFKIIFKNGYNALKFQSKKTIGVETNSLQRYFRVVRFPLQA